MPVISAFALILLWAQSDPRAEGIAAFNEGRYSVALKKLAAYPDDKQARLFYALAQTATHDCSHALPVLLAMPEERLAGLAAANCYSAAGQEGKLFALLDEMTARWPKDADVLYLRAKMHMKAFNDATLAMFERAPSSFRVHELSAQIFEVQNRFAEAASEYRKAIGLNPQAPDLHFRLGRVLLLQGHEADSLRQAAAAFQAELLLNPEDAACEFQLGQIAQLNGDRIGARQHFGQAVNMSPSFVQALIALGKLEQGPEAIRLLTRAIELEPANENAHYALMTAYRNSGDMQKAKAEKATLDKLQKPADGEFSDFLKKLGEKPQ